MDRDNDTIFVRRRRGEGAGALWVQRIFTPMELSSTACTPSAALIAFALAEMGDALDKEEAKRKGADEPSLGRVELVGGTR
jgi:hypothetical protein